MRSYYMNALENIYNADDHGQSLRAPLEILSRASLPVLTRHRFQTSKKYMKDVFPLQIIYSH
jgi:hypothetical protein